MRQILFILIAFFALTTSSFGQTYRKKLIKEKYHFDLLTMQKKYDEQVNSFYKSFTDSLGGKDSLIKRLKGQDSDYKAWNWLITSEQFDEPRFDKISGDTIRAIIKHKIKFYENSRVFYMQKYYVAISTDKGKKWFFLDSSLCGLCIKKIFPDINSILEMFLIPTSKLINEKEK